MKKWKGKRRGELIKKKAKDCNRVLTFFFLLVPLPFCSSFFAHSRARPFYWVYAGPLLFEASLRVAWADSAFSGLHDSFFFLILVSRFSFGNLCLVCSSLWCFSSLVGCFLRIAPSFFCAFPFLGSTLYFPIFFLLCCGLFFSLFLVHFCSPLFFSSFSSLDLLWSLIISLSFFNREKE